MKASSFTVVLMLALSVVFSASTGLQAQTLPYIALGTGAQYNPANGDYSSDGIGVPIGRHNIVGNVVPDGTFFPRPGVFFEGTFEGTQVVSTRLGKIYMDLSGDVLLEIDETTGVATGTWYLTFEITGGTGLYRHASGSLKGVAVNPPFDPNSTMWGFNWAMRGRINLGWFD